MPLSQLFSFIQERRSHYAKPSENLAERLLEIIKSTWYLGFIAFGGPPAHFQIFHKKFVEEREGRTPWIDEQTYQELFALSQALPGPGSTKFLFNVSLIRTGWICAFTSFLLWSLPGAVGMFGLSLGVERISETLPVPVYALLSGLNASTVGIVAVAAVGLAEKCIKDHLSRILVIFGACAGLCYSALWYFPILVVAGGIAAVVWDLWLGKRVKTMKQNWETRKHRAADQAAMTENEAMESATDRNDETASIELRQLEPVATAREEGKLTQRRREVNVRQTASVSSSTIQGAPAQVPPTEQQPFYGVSVTKALIVLAAFIASFITIMVLRSNLSSPPLSFSLFASIYLAGTIIFGGGPVVIPLLREYVVTPGWVSPRDFLIGLAIIQAFPGPNFNFAVYLGALTVASSAKGLSTGNALLGAFLGFVGIFAPGLVFAVFSQGVWRKLRTQPIFTALLRGINATAVGLVFTAVYRLWEVGYLTKESTTSAASISGGRSLADEPWWVVVAVITYAGNKWFGVPAAAGIAAGCVLGIVWWGITQR